MTSPRPPLGLLRELDLAPSHVMPLPGGQGEAWRGGDVVLKPVGQAQVHDWLAEVMHDLHVVGIRVQRPVRLPSRRWSADGWGAWHWVEGEHQPHRWTETFAAARGLLAACAAVPPTDVLRLRTDLWAVADRVAWEDIPMQLVHSELAALVGRFQRMLTPSTEPAQLVHTDMCGNVILAPGLPPAVIDMSLAGDRRPTPWPSSLSTRRLVGCWT